MRSSPVGIKKIGDVDFDGQRLYVTRARESFLERLQREREQASKKDEEKDKVQNKKVIFSDDEGETNLNNKGSTNQENENDKPKNGKNMLFDDEDSDTEVTFEIKKQFEGKKGQKVLDLQSRFKSDKRFTLDERFIDDQSDDEKNEEKDTVNDDRVDVGQVDEKSKQLNILQDVLGVTIKAHNSEHAQKTKPKLGMLRYDPMHPEHAKFLAPAVATQEIPKKAKKAKKSKETPEVTLPPTIVENVEVSKEQFYSVSDTLKEALVQPTTFSLRDLFGKKDNDKEVLEESADYIPLPKEKEKKSKNPLDIGERNPFVYDSSDSEDEGKEKEVQVLEEKQEVKAVWRENLFFSKDDCRLREGLLFFSKFEESEGKKERRGLKTVMKKRIYNKERKNQMFKKKIGGRQKSMKKNIRKRN
ncbi:Nucleolar protein 8 [Papilio machaon]|uniref:Nucleolar protein 8 n=1 Tax=Papilio machaon TaxID=76193 RepID=A0A194QWG3_PAPMA|nr:Nucleolar protein 8 [Papilio machaon]